MTQCSQAGPDGAVLGQPALLLRVLQVSDGHAGHLSLAQGLQQALRLAGWPLDWRVLTVTQPPGAGVAQWPWTVQCPPGWLPHLIVGAGSRTQLAVLALKRQCPRALSLLLTRPWLPQGWFDLLVLPQHDRVVPGPRVFCTRQVLNPVQRFDGPRSREAVVLIGGASRRFAFPLHAVWRQIEALPACFPQFERWWLCTSSRTPAGFWQAMPAWLAADARMVRCPVATTSRTNLLALLDRAGRVWVTPDSLSMQSEAWQAGAVVELLFLPPAWRVRWGLLGPKTLADPDPLEQARLAAWLLVRLQQVLQ